MILCDVKDNKRCVVLSILLVCLVSVLCSCGSMSEEEKLQKMTAEDPLITSSRETSAHMKESIEKAKQYIPDTSESDESDPESRVRDEVNEEKETGEDILPAIDSEPDTSHKAEDASFDIPRNEDVESNDVRISASGSDSGSSDSQPSVVITSTDTNIEEGNASKTSGKGSGGNPNIGDYESQPSDYDGYICNKDTGIIHLPTCTTLPEEKNRDYFKTLEEAKAAGYTRYCGHCME